MNLLRFIFKPDKSSQKRSKRTQANSTTVRRTADTALKQYEKTFKDLARYDRGEQLVLPR